MLSQTVELAWLPEPPIDLRESIRSLSSTGELRSKTAHRLSCYRLNAVQLHSLGTAIRAIAAEREDSVRFALLSNATSTLLLPALAASALRHGVWLRTIETEFDQVAAEALSATSAVNQARCHFVLLAVDHRGVPLKPTPGDLRQAKMSVSESIDYLFSLRDALNSAGSTTVVFQTIPPVAEPLFGSFDRLVPGTLRWLVEHFNSELRARVAGSADLLLDAAALAETVGLARWHDPIQWSVGKFPFSLDLVPLYADWVGRLLGAARGTARKCLVLDLDNTLWGGVIGDDGIEGITLGNGSPVGEAFLHVQRTVLALRERGIVLAVSSKNEDETARSPFRLHPEMLVREQHVAVFQANWHDKASNLSSIAESLNLGLDSLVLLDDNPTERAQVRQALPMVAVPELPEEPSLYPYFLLAAGYFEAVGFTSDDRQRANYYSENAARKVAVTSAADLDEFLQGLSMKAIVAPFRAIDRPRVTQLINKSNQFNLTTRRYAESDVARFETSDSGLTLQVRLLDRLGDNGVVSVVICTAVSTEWIIDTWLMSCRVLNRRLEHAILNHIVSQAKANSVDALIGQFIATERNNLVKDHYRNLGFKATHESNSRSTWRLEISTYTPIAVPIELVEEPVVRSSPIEYVRT